MTNGLGAGMRENEATVRVVSSWLVVTSYLYIPHPGPLYGSAVSSFNSSFLEFAGSLSGATDGLMTYVEMFHQAASMGVAKPAAISPNAFLCGSPTQPVLGLYPLPPERELEGFTQGAGWLSALTQIFIVSWTQRAVLSLWLSVGQCPGVEEEEDQCRLSSSSAFKLIPMLQ